MDKFEYLKAPNTIAKRDELNEYGEQGWELVTCDKDYFYFKRKLE